jgi:phospholipid/cholesterol/gamma-HCH transport system substrate-binding protein
MPKSRQAIVGLFAIGGMLLFAVGLFWIGDRRLLFSESTTLKAEFANLGGLKAGAKVLVSGMDAGEVLETRVPVRPGDKFQVRFRVLEKFRPILRSDSVASIQVEGLVGSKVLQVEGGTESGAPIAEGATVNSREPLEIGHIIEQTVQTIQKMNAAVDEVQARVIIAVDTVNDVGEQTRKVVVEVGRDVDDMFITGKKAAQSVNALVEGVREGKGSLGKLVNDDGIYNKTRDAIAHLEAAAGSARKTSQDVNEIVADLQSRNIGANAEKTMANLQQVTGQARDAMAGLLPPGGRGAGGAGPMEEIRHTLANTREATADLADNMEALKRNWLFRGFFRSRGFYDLNAVSREDYLKGKIAPDRGRERFWVHRSELFGFDAKGAELLSEAGKAAIDKSIAPYLAHSPNTPLMVEGYAAHDNEPEQFLRSRDRARAVRQYLIDRFGLNARYIGAVPMGGVPSTGPNGELWDGVAVVWFPEKDRK